MKVYALTIAFCPASQFARTMLEWTNSDNCSHVDRHIVVDGHYPINTKKNSRDIKLLCQSFPLCEYVDYGADLGCAQTQTRVMHEMHDFDAFVNVDPDSACKTDWLWEAMRLMETDENCIVASCMSPLVEKFIASRNISLEKKTLKASNGFYNANIGIARNPIPFNLSLWRCDFFRSIGGVPQMGEKWGETEGPTYSIANQQGKYHAYLLDHMEDEQGKLMQDRQLLEYKDAHLRSGPENRFFGYYEEYLRWKHPNLIEMDTEIPGDTIFQ